MASPSTAEVQAMISTAIQIAVADVDVRFGAILQEEVSRQQAEVALKAVIDEAKKEFEDSRQRIDTMCHGFNTQFEDHKTVIEKIVTEFHSSTGTLATSTQEARVETKTLKEELVAMEGQHTKLREELATEFAQRTASLATIRKEMSDWAEQHNVTVMTMLQQGGGGGSMDQGSRSGQGHGQGGKGPSIDKKEVSLFGSCQTK